MARTLSSAVEASARAECYLKPAIRFIIKSSTKIGSIVPNPMYSFLPIVIAKNLRSPSAKWTSSARSCRAPMSCRHSVASGKLKFNCLCALFWSRGELPFLDRVQAGLNQQGMSTHSACALHPAVRCNDHFDLDLADHVHPPGKFRVRPRHLVLYFSLTFLDGPRLRKPLRSEKPQQHHAR